MNFYHFIGRVSIDKIWKNHFFNSKSRQISRQIKNPQSLDKFKLCGFYFFFLKIFKPSK